MEINFLVILFFLGLVIAAIQDLKRREVDNWLNLLLVFSSIAYVVFLGIFSHNSSRIIFACMLLLIGFILANLFYYARFFAGGDAKLFFAMSAFFVGASFFESLQNLGLFFILLLVCGGLWSLGFSGYLLIKNFKSVWKEFKTGFSRVFRYSFFAGIILLVLSYIYILLLIPAILLLVVPGFFLLLRTIERVALVKKIETKNLKEGDWLFKDIKVHGKIVKKDWNGISQQDISFLRKYLKNKIVLIREGIPFVPGFLIAFLVYIFFKERIFEWITSFFLGL